MSIVEKLTEGIVNRDLSKDGSALISKWEKTGLLEGIGDDTKPETKTKPAVSASQQRVFAAASTTRHRGR